MTGLTIRNTGGYVTLDMTSKISQNVSSVVTNSVNGSITIPAAPAGKSLYFSVSPLITLDGWKARLPGIVLTGNTLSWTYSYATNGWGLFSANCRIYYGYY